MTVELVGGGHPAAGHVEIIINGERGTVCANGRWHLNEARVICHMLGYR